MPKAQNPTTFARHFGVKPAALSKLGVLNPTLALDSLLFIDPLLLSHSQHPEMRSAARTFRSFFTNVIQLLQHSKAPNDVAWRNADRIFRFPEIPGTCLGYGANSIRGSAFGPKLRKQLLSTAHEIVSLGVVDPDLFLMLALFEKDFGPDRISDLTTNVILDDLLRFNARVLKRLGVPVEPFTVKGKAAALPVNPFAKSRTPVILVPHDVLRSLPIAVGWDGVESAAAANSALRARVNAHVSEIWTKKSKRDKKRLRDQVLVSKDAVKAVLEAIRSVPADAYSLEHDPEGRINWASTGSQAAASHPLTIPKPTDTSLASALTIVRTIVRQFRHLVEQNGLWKSLWHGRDALPEKYAQLLFFAIAYGYCHANNLDLSPEVDSGNGQVDFKFSKGFEDRVLVEIKLSNHNKVVPGYTSQLEAYKAAEQTLRAVYLVIDVGRMGTKAQRLRQLRNAAAARKEPASDLEFVDAKQRASASKRK